MYKWLRAFKKTFNNFLKIFKIVWNVYQMPIKYYRFNFEKMPNQFSQENEKYSTPFEKKSTKNIMILKRQVSFQKQQQAIGDRH